MATLTKITPAITGTTYALVAASGGGDKFTPGDNTYFHVNNGGGSSITVTVDVPGNTKYQQAAPDVAVTVANGAQKIIGPFPADLAGASDGLISITYSGVTSVTVAAVGY